MKYIYLLLLLFIISNNYAQKRTIISGFVGDAKDTVLDISLSVYDSRDLTVNSSKQYNTKTKNGYFKFELDISHPVAVYPFIHNKHVFMPGVFDIPVEPADSLYLTIPNSEKLGILNVSVKGIGSEKIGLLTDMMSSVLAYYKKQRPYQQQSLHEKFINTDNRIEIADSVYNSFQGKVSLKMKELVRAQVTNSNLDMLFLSLLQSKNDSLNFYFKKYIVNKNRIEPILKSNNVNFQGSIRVLSNYAIVKRFGNVSNNDFNIRIGNRLKFANVIIDEYKNYPIVRDYMLSRITKEEILQTELNGNAEKLFSLYKSVVDTINPHYINIKSIYDYANRNLKLGAPFYNFALPDTMGKIYHLSDFKGKVVLLDFWFNGCGACKRLAPILDDIEEELDSNNVQFISIGIDKLKSWKDGIGIFSSKNALQLYTEEQEENHPLITYLNFSAYPRLVLIDKNGNFIGTPPHPVTERTKFITFIKKFM